MRILGADLGADFWHGLSRGLFNWVCGFWVRIFSGFFQKAPNRRTAHFHENPTKIHTPIQPPFLGGSLVGVWNGWGYGIAFFRALNFQISEPEI